MLEVELMRSINKHFRKRFCWQNFVKTRFCFFYRLEARTGERMGKVPRRGDTQNVLRGGGGGRKSLLDVVRPSRRGSGVSRLPLGSAGRPQPRARRLPGHQTCREIDTAPFRRNGNIKLIFKASKS